MTLELKTKQQIQNRDQGPPYINVECQFLE